MCDTCLRDGRIKLGVSLSKIAAQRRLRDVSHESPSGSSSLVASRTSLLSCYRQSTVDCDRFMAASSGTLKSCNCATTQSSDISHRAGSFGQADLEDMAHADTLSHDEERGDVGSAWAEVVGAFFAREQAIKHKFDQVRILIGL